MWVKTDMAIKTSRRREAAREGLPRLSHLSWVQSGTRNSSSMSLNTFQSRVSQGMLHAGQESFCRPLLWAKRVSSEYSPSISQLQVRLQETEFWYFLQGKEGAFPSHVQPEPPPPPPVWDPEIRKTSACTWMKFHSGKFPQMVFASIQSQSTQLSVRQADKLPPTIVVHFDDLGNHLGEGTFSVMDGRQEKIPKSSAYGKALWLMASITGGGGS